LAEHLTVDVRFRYQSVLGSIPSGETPTEMAWKSFCATASKSISGNLPFFSFLSRVINISRFRSQCELQFDDATADLHDLNILT
jgi:hypothetical protein